MSTTITTAPASTSRFQHTHPSFFGLVGGELFKMRRQWTIWVMVILLIGLLSLPFFIEFTLHNDFKAELANGFFTSWITTNLGLFRALSGFILIILTARAIGQEYALGTVRILLGRGVGRVQLLLAKLTAVAIWGIILLAIDIVLNVLYDALLLATKVGNFDILNHLPANFWHIIGIYLLIILLNMAVTILMAAALSVLTRSLAGGLSASIAWFPVDNILVVIMLLAVELSQSQFWSDLTAYFLGPNLNTMAKVILGDPVSNVGSGPLAIVDGTHTVVTAVIYGVIFALVAVILTWKRDVKE